MRRLSVLGLGVVAALAFACGGGSKQAAGTATAGTPVAGSTASVQFVVTPESNTPRPLPTFDMLQMSVDSSGFHPSTITVKVGSFTRVDIVNNDTTDHALTVYGDEQGNRVVIKGGTIPPGKHGTLTLPAPPVGRFAFADTFHPDLKGMIVVTP
ncbi:MAG TPA: cupredoxin domain-containing protein [Dehalococcoidia bacterium]|nr:cupredoxin domain-containing protein [Dehalococcoidia bacterium]